MVNLHYDYSLTIFKNNYYFLLNCFKLDQNVKVKKKTSNTILKHHAFRKRIIHQVARKIMLPFKKRKLHPGISLDLDHLVIYYNAVR